MPHNNYQVELKIKDSLKMSFQLFDEKELEEKLHLDDENYKEQSYCYELIERLVTPNNKYNIILANKLPILIPSINGTGYTYQDIKYNIYNKGELVAKGNTHKSYDKFYSDDIFCDGFMYPSKTTDMFLINDNTEGPSDAHCYFIFGIK